MYVEQWDDELGAWFVIRRGVSFAAAKRLVDARKSWRRADVERDAHDDEGHGLGL